jgi:hypothetical protein
MWTAEDIAAHWDYMAAVVERLDDIRMFVGVIAFVLIAWLGWTIAGQFMLEGFDRAKWR